MKYVIDKEELINCLYYAVDAIAVKNLLRYEQPVEEIFEGEYLIHSREGSFENPEFWKAMSKINDAKKCKIFIQKETL